MLNYIQEGINRMRSLINDLLQYSRVGRLDLQVEKLDLNELIKEVVIGLQVKIGEENATLKVENFPEINWSGKSDTPNSSKTCWTMR